MSKHTFEDIKSKKENILHRIEPAKKSTTRHITSTPHIKTSTTRRMPVLLKSAFILSVLGGLVYWGLVLFESATIVVVKKQQDVSLTAEQFVAMKNTDKSTPFEIMVLDDTENKHMTLSQTENLSTKAHGSVTFYNSYSKKPVKISAGSYLTDNEGKSYRTNESITIPGYTAVAGAAEPGEVSTTVSAFLPGDTYNTNPTDFTVNAYKGTAKGKQIYAKATSPMTGGALGVLYVLNPNDKGALDAYIDSDLKNIVMKKVYAEVPAGYILYPKAVRYDASFDENATFANADATVPITVKINAVLLKEELFKKNIVKHMIPSIEDIELAEVEVSGIKTLDFSFSDPNQLITKDTQSISFALSGSVSFTWNPPISLLLPSLVSLPENDVLSLISKDKGVVSSQIHMFPPWQKVLPSTLSKIHLQIK